MARLPRISPAGVPVHIIQRGNNRHTCFAAMEDYSAYISWLKEYSIKYAVDIHAWVLMTNHVHLLCTPQRDGAVSSMMQSVGRRYVQYFNYQYQRSGTLWEGRYKSCLVQAEKYLIEVYRYIEMNPVRAKMVEDPSEYVWSSYQVNALAKKSDLCTPHPEYLRLGSTKSERMENYRALFAYHVDGDLLGEIRLGLNKGMAIGHDRFKEEIEKLTGRRLKPQKVGRPIGWRKKMKGI
ncbi:transposase [Methyloprofundus sedimenti]|uniref:Transposase n=1 Tax=Methyloprofundus sedimenti TaxID=1420851 RepID=A0A1V8M9B4_9GAMM|nr:transposase [Methyloprofundus sedimenti]OQK18117.1 transposase [Methyloprofundus sedimenti]